MTLEEIVFNYGIAGLILYVFYKLFSNELRELRKVITELSRKIDKLSAVIEERLRY